MAATGARVRIQTTMGAITVELWPEMAPITVENFLYYVRSGYYVGTIIHRVIRGFMIQGGGLERSLFDRDEGQRPPIPNESRADVRNDTGTIAMARTSDPHSATSQFFINVSNNESLNRGRAPDGVGYAVFGQVVDGMDVVRQIEQVRTGSRGGHRDVPVDTIVITATDIVAG